jgi:hypothetical protein
MMPAALDRTLSMPFGFACQDRKKMYHVELLTAPKRKFIAAVRAAISGIIFSACFDVKT